MMDPKDEPLEIIAIEYDEWYNFLAEETERIDEFAYMSDDAAKEAAKAKPPKEPYKPGPSSKAVDANFANYTNGFALDHIGHNDLTVLDDLKARDIKLVGISGKNIFENAENPRLNKGMILSSTSVEVAKRLGFENVILISPLKHKDMVDPPDCIQPDDTLYSSEMSLVKRTETPKQSTSEKNATPSKNVKPSEKRAKLNKLKS